MLFTKKQLKPIMQRTRSNNYLEHETKSLRKRKNWILNHLVKKSRHCFQMK